MMMDDHKSGKRTAPGDGKTAVGQAARRSVSTPNRRQKQQQQPIQATRVIDPRSVEQDDFDEDQDDVDLEAGHFIPTYRTIPLKGDDDDDDGDYDNDEEDVQSSSSDVYSPLRFANRANAKRRVDEDDDQTVESISSQHFYRRKTSHDGHDLTQPFMTPSTFSSPSPFMPGSPFAKEEHNIFAPSFSQALAQERTGSMHSFHSLQDLSEQEEKYQVDPTSIMMESFTTFDEPMTSPLNDLHSSTSSVYSFGAPSPPSTTTSTPVFSAQRGSFSVPATIHPGSSMLYSPVSPFTPSFASALPLNWSAANMTSMPGAQGLNSSFLDTTQIQEFQNFRQNGMNTSQQFLQQQQLMMQLQRNGAQQQRFPSDAKPPVGHWAPTPPAEKKDPLQSLKAVLAQTINASSGSYIPIPTSFPDNVGSEYSNATSPSVSSMPSPLLLPKSVPMPMSMSNPSLVSMDGDVSSAAQLAKKRGRPRRSLHGRLPPLTKITTTTPSSSSASSMSSTTTTTGATTPASEYRDEPFGSCCCPVHVVSTTTSPTATATASTIAAAT
ncbi:hypothetical protein B0O80DRAFT_64823 [Mortierella sp. GBAus27b]|nr:hypothetical protein B0O80DRAFT_64823 [Mortierella sp. GBAus27b]